MNGLQTNFQWSAVWLFAGLGLPNRRQDGSGKISAVTPHDSPFRTQGELLQQSGTAQSNRLSKHNYQDNTFVFM